MPFCYIVIDVYVLSKVGMVGCTCCSTFGQPELMSDYQTVQWSAVKRVGHAMHVHHKVLIEIIIPKPLVQPIDSDIIIMMIVYDHFTITINKKTVATLCHYCYKLISP